MFFFSNNNYCLLKADVWKNKVDRPCVERIRAFQNPPTLIGQIMEMIIILIGKNKLPESAALFKSDQTSGGKDDKSNPDNAKQNKPRKKP